MNFIFDWLVLHDEDYNKISVIYFILKVKFSTQFIRIFHEMPSVCILTDQESGCHPGDRIDCLQGIFQQKCKDFGLLWY